MMSSGYIVVSFYPGNLGISEALTYVNEVDEGVAHVAIVVEVDSEVHEVILAPARLVHNVLQHGLVNLVGNVAQHDLRKIRPVNLFYSVEN